MMKYSDFPAKFADFFTTPNPSEEEEDVNISDILEDKLIPRRYIDSESRSLTNRFDKDRKAFDRFGYEEKVRQVNNRRSFHRATRKYHNVSPATSDTASSTAYCRVQSPSSRSSDSTESSKLSDTTSVSSTSAPHAAPHPQRMRSSSITITRGIPDLHRFLQIEQNNPWGHHKERPSDAPRLERSGSSKSRGSRQASPTRQTSRQNLIGSRPSSPARQNSRSNLIATSRPTSPAPPINRTPSRSNLSRPTSPAPRTISRSASPSRDSRVGGFRSVSPPAKKGSPRRVGSKREKKAQHGAGAGGRTRTVSMPVAPRIRPMLGKISSARNVNEEPSGDIEDGDVEYYRLRSFSITPHGICSLGDSFRSRRSKSNSSVNSTTSSNSGTIGSGSQISLVEESNLTPVYKVGMIGASGVGKTSLITKFSTSEKTCLYDASLGK
ncbi:hypothetical protein M8J75_011105 [Diaphorina citri]|nr:hypothetical protein M8J75_011105 [Diaphorina citri]